MSSSSGKSTTSTTSSGDPVISHFINEYVRSRYFYSEIASLAGQLCEMKLESAGIRAIVTYRAKTTQRLEAKLYQRSRSKPYQSEADIRKDIVDLAGVRIALYFPNDSLKVSKIIEETFHLIKYKPYPIGSRDPYRNSLQAPRYTQRFDGYLADHYRVRMRSENVADKATRSTLKHSRPMVEIQVASVLMHAWAEVNHDLVYKELNGSAPPEEQRILDAVNGLVHTGELLLQQLQLAVDGRVHYQNERFKDQFELRSFLRQNSEEKGMWTEKLDVLLEVLRQLKLDSPKKLSPLLPPIKEFKSTTYPVALKILDHIIHPDDHPNRHKHSISLITKPLTQDFLGYFPKGGGHDLIISATDFSDVSAQKNILRRAIEVVDAIRYPTRSILVVDLENIPAELKTFQKLWSDISFLRPERMPGGSEYKVSQDMVEALDKLWAWFVGNPDILFRVALKIARLEAPNIVEQLIKLQPSDNIQRQARSTDHGRYRSKSDRRPLGRAKSQERMAKAKYKVEIVEPKVEQHRKNHSYHPSTRRRKSGEDISKHHRRSTQHRSSYTDHYE